MKSTGYTKQHAAKGLKESLPAIEAFPNQYADYEITIEAPEFTSICPKTGLPDFGFITIRYVPHRWVVELKALKLYLNGYRNLGIFQENAVNRILQDFVKVVRPVFCEVAGCFASRGGLKTRVTARYGKQRGLQVNHDGK